MYYSDWFVVCCFMLIIIFIGNKLTITKTGNLEHHRVAAKMTESGTSIITYAAIFAFVFVWPK